jgi:prevent-host-death family protein
MLHCARDTPLSRPVAHVMFQCYVTTVITMRGEFIMARMIKASEFKTKCLAIMDEVQRTGQPVVITKKGKPVAELVPHRARKKNARGILKDRLFITGDIISPIDVEWEALK